MIGPAPLCLDCKHYDVENEIDPTCRAFPQRIPDPIWLGEIEHRQHYPGDRGIQFEQKVPGREYGFVRQ